MDELFQIPPLSEQSESWLGSILPELSDGNAVGSLLDGSFDLDAESIVGRLTELFLGELRLSLRTLALLTAMGIFSAVLRNLRASFGRESVGAAAELAATAYLAAIALGVFSTAADCAETAVADLTAVMDAMVPVTLSLMLSGGMAVSGTVIHPIIYFMCRIMSQIISSVVIPLALLSMTLELFGSISSGVNVRGLAGLCRRLNSYLLGFVMVIFTGVLSVTKFAAASFDGLGARGLKFAVSAAVPLVGNSIADAMSSVAGGSILLKNTVGAVGVAALIGIASMPVIKIGVLSLTFRAGGALTAPLGGEKIADAMGEMAGCLETLAAAAACTGIMLVISVIAIMS